MNRLLFLVLLCLSAIITWAIPATPKPITYFQPDGRQLTIQLAGDEYSHFIYSEDGYTLVADSDGTLHYATLQKNGILKSSGIVAQSPKQRTAVEKRFLRRTRTNLQAKQASISVKQASASGRRNFPTIGQQKSLVILVNFADVSFVIPNPNKAFYDLLNATDYQENEATGSARDYFLAASNGQFKPNFVVVGPYTLPQPMAYYGENANGEDKNPAQMILDACTLANDEVDFTEYDSDNDGKIDNVFVFYAGYNEAETADPNMVWPHRWEVGPQNSKGNRVFDGKTLYSYACTSELKDNNGNQICGIGTFCHEFGHVLGLPDYYHTTDDTKKTLKQWDIMDYGSYSNEGRTPPTYSAYTRFYLGWLTPNELLQPQNVILNPINQSKTTITHQNQAYLIAQTAHNLDGKHPSPAEFFIVEYRKKIGWDTYLPSEGLLIWHIDFLQSAWTNNTVNNYSGKRQTPDSHMRIYLQPISGQSTTTPGGAFTFGSFTPTLWDNTTLTATLDGLVQSKEITSISLAADKESLSFYFMGGTGIKLIPPILNEPTNITMSSFTASWHNDYATDSLSLGYLLTVYEHTLADSVRIYDKQKLTDTSFVLVDLKPETRYTYYVQAVIEQDNRSWMTDPSEWQSVTTLPDKNAKKMATIVQPIGTNTYNLIVVKEISTDPLYVYDSSGRLIYTDYTPLNNIIFSSERFLKGDALIFKSGKRTAKWVF